MSYLLGNWVIGEVNNLFIIGFFLTAKLAEVYAKPAEKTFLLVACCWLLVAG